MPPVTWTRLDPGSRDEEMQSSLEARVHDPLWMLARQWQLGEFEAEDAGSPALVEVWSASAPLARFTPAPGSGSPASVAAPYDTQTLPLEPLVERERVTEDPAQSRARAVESGVQFLRALHRQGMAKHQAAFVRQYPVAAASDSERAVWDAAAIRFLDLTAGRVPDGTALHAAVRAVTPAAAKLPSLPAAPAIPAADVPKVQAALASWMSWHVEPVALEPAPAGATADPRPTATPDAPAWRRDRMEYEFTLTSGAVGDRAPVTLAATEYADAHLDWYAFDLVPAAAGGGTAAVRPPNHRMFPTPVTYPGMPASRYWEFEDARVNLAAVRLDARGALKDLAGLVFLEFALVYGNNWFVAPMELPVGSVCRVDALLVTDTFGERTSIRAANPAWPDDGDWAMFALSARESVHAQPGGAGSLLLLPPSLVGSLHSAPIEEVLLVRDEMANMAWAVERLVDTPTGRPLQRHELSLAARERAALPAAADAVAALAYRISSDVPEHWIPLVPVAEAGGGMHLERARFGTAAQAHPLGRILGTVPLELREEEVPRGGARITRSYQYARWVDGSTHLWVGRRNQPGRGEASSGLQFDRVQRAGGAP